MVLTAKKKVGKALLLDLTTPSGHTTPYLHERRIPLKEHLVLSSSTPVGNTHNFA